MKTLQNAGSNDPVIFIAYLTFSARLANYKVIIITLYGFFQFDEDYSHWAKYLQPANSSLIQEYSAFRMLIYLPFYKLLFTTQFFFFLKLQAR